MNDAYQEFLRRKVAIASDHGMAVSLDEINPRLFDWQRRIVCWAIAGGRRALFLKFGLGKTVQQLEIERLILSRTGGRGLIVTYLGVRQEFQRDAVNVLGWAEPPRFIRSIDEADDTGIYLTNYETIRDGKLDPRHFNVASLDEGDCFPSGTMIETPNGFVPIECVKIGDKIYNAAGVDLVKDTFRHEVTKAVRIRCGEREIVSSDNHRYFTLRGWVAAAELQPGDAVVETTEAVRLVREAHCSADIPGSQKALLRSILLSEMASDDAGRKSECAEGRTSVAVSATTQDQSACALASAETMRALRDNDKASDSAGGAEAILQQVLLCNMADAAASHSSKGLQQAGRSQEACESAEVVGLEYAGGARTEGALGGAGAKPEHSTAREDDRNHAGAGDTAEMDWRQGARTDEASASAASRARQAMDCRAPGANSATPAGSANLPLSRPSASFSHDCDRSGWLYSHDESLERPGRQKGRISAVARLDSVEILECGHPDLERYRDADGRIYFYDLTATRHPSFSVDGLLVHNCLRGFGGTKTFRECMRLFAGDGKALNSRERSAGIPYRFVATATPSPNELLELAAYAAFLGVMEVADIKSRFFKRDSTKADHLTLQPGREREFWMWCSSWALFLERPSDMGPEYSDAGYELPPLEVRWHEVASDHSGAGAERDGQRRMFRDAGIGVVDAAREKRDTLSARISKMLEIRAIAPDAHRIIWHDLEAEREAIEEAVPSVASVYGSQDLETREQIVSDFKDGFIRELASKPSLLGSGTNLQRHCHQAIYLGIGWKFRDFIQSIHRLQRYLQQHPVQVDLIYTEAERGIRMDLERKWSQHQETVETMTGIIKEYGLSHQAMAQALTRSLGIERVEVSGDNYKLVNNDCVLETRTMTEASVDLVLTSVPFANQYSYSPRYEDFGHSDTNAHFFEQMDFLTPELLRVLKPGRVAAIHVKDRIVPGGMTGLGFQTVYPFHARCIEHYTRHGFAYMGMKTVVTDVVRENNQTYRLGWTEQCKDGTKMGCGMPEYLLLFRKPPTDTSNSYADEPVVKSKDSYSRSRWQIDAHGFARSSGNRLLQPQELEGLPHDVIFKLFRDYGLTQVYDFEHHVRLGEALDARGMLPVTFMLLQPPSWHPDVWADITRMLTLNGAQSAKGREMHLCPLPIDLADRVIEQFSMPGETVLDPFNGIGTTVYRAILKKRRGVGIELNTRYFLDSASYCKAAEQEVSMPDLFSATTGSEAAA